MEHANELVRCGLQAGFRESGAVSLTGHGRHEANPVVAIRSSGLGLESLLGVIEADGTRRCTVSSGYLGSLVRVANERFAENRARRERFMEAVDCAFHSLPRTTRRGAEWEDTQARRERKRREGLERQSQLRESRGGGVSGGDGSGGTVEDDGDDDEGSSRT